MKRKIIFFGDSIIRYRKKNYINDWSQLLINKISKNNKNKYKFVTRSITGLNSRTALEILPGVIKKIFENDIIVIQIGLNDSWHFKSLKGNANVSIRSFKANLNEIYKKCVKKGLKNIYFVNYHKILKDRKEINKKNINQNLSIYNNYINTFCKKKKIKLINIAKNTKKINPKIMCLPNPDGVHLSKNGIKIYANIIFNNLIKNL